MDLEQKRLKRLDNSVSLSFFIFTGYPEEEGLSKVMPTKFGNLLLHMGAIHIHLGGPSFVFLRAKVP